MANMACATLPFGSTQLSSTKQKIEDAKHRIPKQVLPGGGPLPPSRQGRRPERRCGSRPRESPARPLCGPGSAGALQLPNSAFFFFFSFLSKAFAGGQLSGGRRKKPPCRKGVTNMKFNMMQKGLSVLFSLLLLFSAAMTGSYAWRDIAQHRSNEFYGRVTSAEPDTSTTEPDTSSTEPDTTTTEPDTSTTEPDTSTIEPDTSTTEPDTTTTEPDTTTTEPDTTTTEPDTTTTTQPTTTTTQPTTTTTTTRTSTTKPTTTTAPSTTTAVTTTTGPATQPSTTAAATSATATTGSTKPQNPNGPKTGDTSNIWLWAVITIISAIGLRAVLLWGRRERRGKDLPL